MDRPTERGAAGAVLPLAAARLLRGWVPLHGWSGRRRAAVAAAIGVAACAAATGACMSADVGGAMAAAAALTAVHRELADAQRALDTLPELERAAARAARAESQRTGRSPDDARDLSELAAATGIGLVSLEPGTRRAQEEPRGADAKRDARGESFRVLKLTAQGDFPRLRAFLRGLARAPALTVPAEAVLTRNGSRLSLAATLSVFDRLASLPDAVPADDAAALSDPFAGNRADGATTAGGLRLTGVLRDRSRALALIETPRGTEAVQQGARIDRERVASIGMGQVTLALDGTTRVLKWPEDGR